MIHQKKLLAVLVGLACSTVAARQSNINPMMGKPNACGAFKIAFINGIDTERDAAEENLETHHDGVYAEMPTKNI